MDREEFRLLAKECLRETTPCDADLDGLFATWDNNGNGKGSVPIKPAIVQMVAAHHALLAKESEMARRDTTDKVPAVDGGLGDGLLQYAVVLGDCAGQ